MKAAYAPHRITRLRALNDTVLVKDMQFKDRKLSSGIILPGDNGKATGIRARWGEVYEIGPEQKDVRPGQWICVAHGRWTRGLDIEDGDVKRTIRKIDPKDILISADERPNDLTFSDAIHIERKER
jgi:co-chaperonin GroES (HSP10)